MSIAVLVLVVAVIVVTTGAFSASRFKKAAPDQVLVKFGKVGGAGKSAVCLHGGATMVWPVVQGYGFLDLTPISIDIKLGGALSKQNIRVNTPATFTIGVSTEENIMILAAERLLGLSLDQIKILAQDIIFGQMRDVIATMAIEDINTDREQLITNISDSVEVELRKVGLRLINVNIQDITDESGYLDALGREAAERAINEAAIKVAEKQRDGAIGVASAERERRVAVAQAEAQATEGEKKAERQRRVAVADADAAAVEGEKKAESSQRIAVSDADARATEGENTAKVSIAESNSDRRQSEAEASRAAVTAERVTEAKAAEDSFHAEAAAEKARAERETESRRADEIVPAEIQRERIRTLAEAEADRVRLVQRGEADGRYAGLEAEAKGVRAELEARADGISKIVEAAGTASQAGALMMVEHLPKIVSEIKGIYEHIQIDKVVVWDSGTGDGEGSTTANWLKGAVGVLPQLHELASLANLDLPEILGSLNDGETAEAAAHGDIADNVIEAEADEAEDASAY